MEKRRNIKTENILRFAIWILILSFVIICVCYLSWAALFRPMPGNQPELSVKEKRYFDEMEGKEGWDYVRRSVYNISKSDESLHRRLVDLDKDYAYIFRTKINDSITFFSLPNKTEDTIALHLYSHMIHKNPRLKKIIIIFNYEEDLNERASIGHSRTEEYAVRGKRLVKLKHDME